MTSAIRRFYLVVLVCSLAPGIVSATDSCAAPSPAVDGINLGDTTGYTTDGPFNALCDEQGTTGGDQIFNDEWLLYTATQTGTLAISTCAGGVTTFDSAIAVYGVSTCPTPADLLACDDDGPGPLCPGFQSLLAVDVVAGSSYLIQIGGFAPTEFGPYSVELSYVASVVNNDCSNALQALDGMTPYDSTYATTTGAALDPAVCDLSAFGDEQIKNDLFFIYTATQNATAQVSTCNLTPYDTRLAVYDNAGCPAAPVDVIACNDDGAGCANLSSQTIFNAILGQTYLIRVGGFGASDAGPGTLEISYISGPANDDCAGAIPVSEGITTVNTLSATTTGAPITPGACSILCDPSVTGPCWFGADGQIYFDLWYQFTPTQTDRCRISTCDPAGFDSRLAVYSNTNCPADPADVLACNDDARSFCALATSSLVDLDVTQGTTYLIRVGGFSGAAGMTDLEIRYLPPAVENLSCTANPTTGTVALTWDLPGGMPYTAGINIYADGMLDTTIAGSATSYTFNLPSGFVPPLELCVEGEDALNGLSDRRCCTIECEVLNLTCDFDCVTGSVELSWEANPLVDTYEVFRGNTSVAVLAGAVTGYSDLDPTVGAQGVVQNYEVVATCSTGAPGTSTCFVLLDQPAAAPDLILALEGDPLAGAFGDIDSAATLESALQSAGRSTALLRTPFSEYDCLSDLLAVAENVWVVDGTFPDNYRLTQAEGDQLAAIASTRNVYFESGDHWGFVHVPSNLDLIDGVDETVVDDGDDSLTQLDGQSGLGAALDLSFYSDLSYTQDQMGLDYNDQLVLSTTDPVAADVIWRNSDDLGGFETDYAVGVASLHGGGRMISVSFEFGGLSGGFEQLLIEDYLLYFAPAMPQLRRGDCNNDGTINIADAITALGILFPAGPPPVPDCAEACNANDDDMFNIADAIALLGSLFGSPPIPLPAPGSTCGFDPTPTLPCDSSACP